MKRLFMILGVMFLFLSMMMPIAVRADEAQLSFTVSGSTLTVAAPAGALDGNTSLYLVYDSADRGTELEKWANSIKYENDVSDAEALYDFDISTVPEKSVMRVLAISEIRLMDGYISLGEGQYIDTGILATEAYGLEFKYFHTNVMQPGVNNFDSLIGSVRDDFTIGCFYWDGRDGFYLRWQGADYGQTFPGLAISSDTNVISIVNGEVKINGTHKENVSGAMAKNPRPILVGATWDIHSPYTELSGRYFAANWFYIAIFDANGEKLIDLVPALRSRGDVQEAVFYDKVSKRIYSKSGIGHLSYHSEKIVNKMEVTVSYSLGNGHVQSAKWTGKGETSSIFESANWAPALPAYEAEVTVSIEEGKCCDVFDGIAVFSKFLLGGYGQLNLSGTGKVEVSGDTSLGFVQGESPTVEQSGGKFVSKGYFYIANGGTAEYVMKDGSFSCEKELQIGAESNCEGKFYMSGGTVFVNGCTHIGANDKGFFTLSDGQFKCGNWTTLGRWGNGAGEGIIKGGQFQVDGGGLNIGEDGTGYMIVCEKGLLNVTSGYGIKLGANGSGKGSLKLYEEGKIVARFIKKGAGTVNGVEFDGGTIEAKADAMDFLCDLGEIQLKEGGVAIDTKGKNIGIRNCTFKVSGGGKIRVLGGGSVTFENVAVKFNGNPPEGTYVFAEYQGEDSGKFVNASTITASRRRAKVSENDRKISFLPNGFMVIVM